MSHRIRVVPKFDPRTQRLWYERADHPQSAGIKDRRAERKEARQERREDRQGDAEEGEWQTIELAPGLRLQVAPGMKYAIEQQSRIFMLAAEPLAEEAASAGFDDAQIGVVPVALALGKGFGKLVKKGIAAAAEMAAEDAAREVADVGVKAAKVEAKAAQAGAKAANAAASAAQASAKAAKAQVKAVKADAKAVKAAVKGLPMRPFYEDDPVVPLYALPLYELDREHWDQKDLAAVNGIARKIHTTSREEDDELLNDMELADRIGALLCDSDGYCVNRGEGNG